MVPGQPIASVNGRLTSRRGNAEIGAPRAIVLTDGRASLWQCASALARPPRFAPNPRLTLVTKNVMIRAAGGGRRARRRRAHQQEHRETAMSFIREPEARRSPAQRRPKEVDDASTVNSRINFIAVLQRHGDRLRRSTSQNTSSVVERAGGEQTAHR
jgi:hypothetical protein